MLAVVMVTVAVAGATDKNLGLHSDGGLWKFYPAPARDEQLPNILLIGDSIMNGYHTQVINGLKGKANADCWLTPMHLNSSKLHRDLAKVASHRNYAVIHFNMGLHGWQEGRIPKGKYQELLESYVAILKEHASGAKLIWASTTQVHNEGTQALDEAINPIVVRRNEIADAVMKEGGMTVNDLYGLMSDKLERVRGDKWHWQKEAYEIMAQQIMEKILAKPNFAAGGGSLLKMNRNGTDTKGFVHPGILHTASDLDRMRKQVAASAQPYLDGFKVLASHWQSSSSYRVKGGFEETGRKPSVKSSEHESDANAAYQNAMMWAITGQQAHAHKAIEIINAWSYRLKIISGRDRILAAGISGVKFVAAAEILRHTNTGWPAQDIAQAESMFTNVYYPVLKDMAGFANGNWALAALQTVMAIGVFTDDRAMFDRAVDWFHHGKDNACLTHYVINAAGQCQESGRDQQHTMLGLGYLSVVAEISWNQGLDLYGAEDNRILAGFEYTASYNLGHDVPFQETTDTTGKYHHTSISSKGRGRFSGRPIFEMVYNHYKHRRGIACPFTESVVNKIRAEGPGFLGDHIGFGTILFTREVQ